MTSVTKKQAEWAIFERFLIAFKNHFGYSLIDIKHQDKPDFVAVDPKNKRVLGIEITGVYQNQKEAMIQYSVIENWEIFFGSFDELISALNLLLEKKARKSYRYEFDGDIVLAIWVGSLLFNERKEFDHARERIKVPKHQFSEIWLILHNRNTNSPELIEI